eukprot:5448496-Amphidinium_carterae.1
MEKLSSAVRGVQVALPPETQWSRSLKAWVQWLPLGRKKLCWSLVLQEFIMSKLVLSSKILQKVKPSSRSMIHE